MDKNTKIDNIKALFAKIPVKERLAFYDAVADEFGIAATTVRTHWFVRFEIMDRHKVQDNLIAFMQNYIANLNGVLV